MPRQQRTAPLVPYAWADEYPSANRAGLLDLSGPESGSGANTTSVRKVYIQHLVDIVHSCLLKRDLVRAKRAWAILVRCREVNWYDRWRWGLAILQAQQQTQAASQGVGLHEAAERRRREGGVDEVEDWLKTLRLSAVEVEKPAILHALVLHYISTEQYRLALDELDTYLTSYPYILSGPLHTYAGLLSFYLAQPQSARRDISGGDKDGGATEEATVSNGREGSTTSSSSSSRSNGTRTSPSAVDVAGVSVNVNANATMLRQAKTWFIKALEIAPDEVASEYIREIDDILAAQTRILNGDHLNRGIGGGGNGGGSGAVRQRPIRPLRSSARSGPLVSQRTTSGSSNPSSSRGPSEDRRSSELDVSESGTDTDTDTGL